MGSIWRCIRVVGLLLVGWAGVGSLVALMWVGAGELFWALALVCSFVCFVLTTHVRG